MPCELFQSLSASSCTPETIAIRAPSCFCTAALVVDEDAEIATPWFQINFFPDFTQVYFLVLSVLVAPTLVHLVPAIVAENAGALVIINAKVSAVTIDKRWRVNIKRDYLSAFVMVNS